MEKRDGYYVVKILGTTRQNIDKHISSGKIEEGRSIDYSIVFYMKEVLIMKNTILKYHYLKPTYEFRFNYSTIDNLFNSCRIKEERLTI